MIKLEIAGLVIQLNMPMKLLPDYMDSFLYKGTKDADIYWDVLFDDMYKHEGTETISNEDISIYEEEHRIIYEYKKEPYIPFMIVAEREYSKCRFFVPKEYEDVDLYTKKTYELIQLCLYNSFREMFVLRCTYMNRLIMHAASVLYDKKAYLFSAPSGVGKSTHAQLWAREYGILTLNGDVAIIEVTDEGKKLIFHGCPWCGTSGIYCNKSVDIGAIAFLSRNESNRISVLDKEDVGMRILENHFVPFLNKDIVTKVTVMINRISNHIEAYLLECNKENDAAKLAKEKMVVKGSGFSEV